MEALVQWRADAAALRRRAGASSNAGIVLLFLMLPALGLSSILVPIAMGGLVPMVAGVILFAAMAGLCFRDARTQRARAEALPPPGGSPELARRVLQLPANLSSDVRWRVTRALDAQLHIDRFLVHVRRAGMESEADVLARATAASSLHVVERCETLLRMLAIASPTDAVVAARRSVMADIDANLVELSATMDATATVIAAGTRDAATSLSEHAEALEALAEGLEEAFAPPPMLAASNP